MSSSSFVCTKGLTGQSFKEYREENLKDPTDSRPSPR